MIVEDNIKLSDPSSICVLYYLSFCLSPFHPYFINSQAVSQNFVYFRYSNFAYESTYHRSSLSSSPVVLVDLNVKSQKYAM